MKNEFTEEVVDDLADKLLIGLTKKENKMVVDEFDIVDQNIDIINQIPNINEVEPMTHCLDDFEYELREDVIEESVPVEELFQNCDSYTDREIEVPKVVD